MFARYYNSATGRFLSPDWSASEDPVPYARLDNPQSLNLYAYVLNNPLGVADPNGHDPSVGDQVDAMLEQAWQATADARNLMASAAAEEARKKAKAQPPKPGRQPDGSYIAPTGPGTEIGNITDPAHPLPPMIGNGQCVTACKHFSGITAPTTDWRQGAAVANNGSIPIGTAIATFGSNGRYPTDGDQNSGIYMGPGQNGGVLILDQWPAHPASGTPDHPPQIREMRYSDGRTLSNSAEAYHVIIVP
jgi:RHS repeat-associated protein